MPRDVANFSEKEALGYIKVRAAVAVDPEPERVLVDEVADAPVDQVAAVEPDEISKPSNETPEDPGNWQRAPRKRR
jgi:hypothetical protein